MTNAMLMEDQNRVLIPRQARIDPKRFPKKSTKVHTTPGSSIALQPDAFRGAMNPEEVSFRNNGMLRNPRGDNSQEESGNSLNNSSSITSQERYERVLLSHAQEIFGRQTRYSIE